jgi:hypothetical protein
MTAKQRAFLASYARCGNISQAAKAAKVGRRDHYDWLNANSLYAAAFADAREDAIEALEREARRRAYLGREEPVIYQGELQFKRDKNGKRTNIPLTIPKVSDILLMFLLKSMRPNVYRDNAQLQVTGANGGPVSIEVTFVKPIQTSY